MRHWPNCDLLDRYRRSESPRDLHPERTLRNVDEFTPDMPPVEYDLGRLCCLLAGPQGRQNRGSDNRDSAAFQFRNKTTL
jgi:hypothetical protein